MKNRNTNNFILTWMLTGMLVVTLIHCTDSSEDKKAIPEDKTSVKEVKKETADLIQELGAYTADQRDEAVEKSKTALDELNKRIDAMETSIENKGNQMNEAAREKARASLKGLRKQQAEVAEWYGKLENSSADAWDDTKKGFSAAYKNISDAWEKTENEFNTNN